MTSTRDSQSHLPESAPPGLLYLPEFVSAQEETSLLQHLDQFNWDVDGLVKMRGQVARRREIDFIHVYNRNSRKVSPGRELPSFLQPLRERCEQTLGLAPDAIQQVIATLYRCGARIPWHTDAPAFGDPIWGISLKSDATMRFRRPGADEIWPLILEARSLVVMSGPSRWEYEHEIPDVTEERISITMRTINARSSVAP